MSVNFMIPFAGGSSVSFSRWETSCLDEFVFIDAPGKGRNRKTPMLRSMRDVAAFCADFIEKYLEEHECDEYCLCGHSMGSYLVYEVVKAFSIHGKRMPRCIVLSGTVAPNKMKKETIRNAMVDDNSFMKHLKEFGLLNSDIMESRFFRRQYLPMIKGDYQMLLEYETDVVKISNVEVYVINGLDDDSLSEESVTEWSSYFGEPPKYIWVAGDHFFLLNNSRIIQDVIGIQC